MSDHKPPTDEQIDALAFDIRALASVLDVEPTTITRARYIAHRGSARTVTDAWGAAKGRLMGAPEGFAVAKVTTTIKTAEGSKSTTVVPNTVTLEEAVLPGHRIDRVSTFRRTRDGNPEWIKTVAIATEAEDVLTRLLRDLPSQVPVREHTTPEPQGTADDLLAVYPLGDPHVGLLAWAPESGADFDLRICEDLMTRAMRDLVLRGPRARKALILNLGDYFHADTQGGHTTKGDHSLDLDGRSPRVLAVGMRIMTTLIDAALEHHAEVTVDNRIGNHDGHTSLMLSIALQAHYRNEPRLTVPATVSHRAYYEFGRNLIGATHGDRAKGDRLGPLMAAEMPEAWGRTIFRRWFCGHVHHRQAFDAPGEVLIETYRTLAARDSWHAAQGYDASRDMQRIVIHREHGEQGREFVNVARLLGGMGAPRAQPLAL